MATWNVLETVKLSSDPTKPDYICVRLTIPPNGNFIVTDIRKFKGNKALKIGVSLLPEESKWVFKMLALAESGHIETELRCIQVFVYDTYTTIAVLKANGKCQKIILQSDQRDMLVKAADALTNY